MAATNVTIITDNTIDTPLVSVVEKRASPKCPTLWDAATATCITAAMQYTKKLTIVPAKKLRFFIF